MKKINLIFILVLLSFSNISFAGDIASSGKATGKFALKKVFLPLTIFTMSQDAMAKCEENQCAEEMTLGKGAEITGAVLHTQWVELKEAATGIAELIEVLAED